MTKNGESSGRPSSGWPVVFASFVGIAAGGPIMVLFTLGVFTKPLEAEFGWTRAQVSLVATVFTCASTVAFPIVGVLLDRFGVRRCVLLSLPLFAAAYASLYFVPRNLAVFYLMWAAITVAGAGPSNPAYCKAVAAWFDRRLGLAMGIAVAGQGVGAAAIPALSHWLITRVGWRLAYVDLAVIMLAVTFTVNAAFLRNGPKHSEKVREAAPRSDEGHPFGAAIRTPVFRIIVAVFFLLGFMSTAILAHQVPMLMDAGMTAEKAALVQVVYGLTLTLGRVGVGLSLDRLFAPRVLMVSLGGLVIGLAAYASGVSGNAVFACAALIGFGIGAEFDVLGFLIARYFGRNSYGKLYAVVLATFTLGGGLGAAILGVIRTAHGSYAPGLWAITTTTVLAIFLLSRLEPYPRLAPPQPSHGGAS